MIAPWEIIFLLDAYFRRRGLRQRVKLTLVTPETLPLPLAGPLVGESLRRMMTERGIALITQARILSLDPLRHCLVLDQGITVPGDLFIGIPSHWGPSVLRDSGLVLKVFNNINDLLFPGIGQFHRTVIEAPGMGQQVKHGYGGVKPLLQLKFVQVNIYILS